MSLALDTAMLMGAGLGKRMLPLTADRPKPLVPVAGLPLIDHAIARIEEAGIRRIVVNIHYRAEMMRTHLDAYAGPCEILISDESEQLLETGGGLMKARPLLGEAPFLCANSDNIWRDDDGENASSGGPVGISALRAAWDDAAMDALLLLVPREKACCHQGPGDFDLREDGRLVRRGDAPSAPYVFTGVQILSPRLLKDAPEAAFSTNIFWDRALQAGRLFGVVHHGLWFDVGTPQAIGAVEEILGRG